MMNKKRDDLDIKQTPEVFIDQQSTPDEVMRWLEAKEFDTTIQKKLKEFSGQQILGLTRAQCKLICGTEEGKRLYSQLSVQKNVCGVSTNNNPILVIKDLLFSSKQLEVMNYELFWPKLKKRLKQILHDILLFYILHLIIPVIYV